MKPKLRMPMLEMFLPFMGLLSQYTVGGLSVSLFFLLLITLFHLLRGSVVIRKIYSNYYLFFGYVLLRDIVNLFAPCSVERMTQLNRMLEYILFFVCVFIVVESFNENVLYKAWKVAGVIFSAGLFFHVVQIYVFKHPIMPISIIPGYVLRDAELVAQSRPTSFFAEPASFVNSMLPFLFLSLRKREYAWAAFSSVMILLSTSTVGIVLAMVLWMAFILFEEKSKHVKISLGIMVFAIVLICLQTSLFASSIQKLMLVLQGKSTFGSRVLISLEVVGTLNPVSLLFGEVERDACYYVLSNISKFSLGSQAVLYAREVGRVFLNTFGELIFRYGIVGLGLFLYTFKGKVFSQKYGARIFAMMILVSIFAQSVLLNPQYFLVTMILILFSYTEKNERIGNKIMEGKT